MWSSKLSSADEPWLTHFGHTEIYDRLSNFYNHVLGTASSLSIRLNDKTLREDIENMRFNMTSGQCKLYVLKKRDQEHLIMEYPISKNATRPDSRWKPHFFSQRRFYLLPSKEQYVAIKNDVNMEVLIDRFRVSGVIDETLLFEELVENKKKLSGEYSYRQVKLALNVYRALNPLYQQEKNISSPDTFNDLLDEYSDPDKIEIHDDFLTRQSTKNLEKSNNKFIYRNEEVSLEVDVFSRYLAQVIKRINERAKDEKEAVKSVWVFMNSLYLEMKKHHLEYTEAAKILIKQSVRYRQK